MTDIRKMPIGIQSFEDLRVKDFLYVDKTSYIEKLASANKVFFLSRPRRFGKSLFLSTLKAWLLKLLKKVKKAGVRYGKNIRFFTWILMLHNTKQEKIWKLF